jgi:septal ring factor EnvC (AmiA/AmiB activator)
LTDPFFAARQRSLVAVETDKEKLETDLLKQQEKMEMMQTQVEKAQKDRQNLQAEMEILLDRINKLSDMLDKTRVNARIFGEFFE